MATPPISTVGSNKRNFEEYQDQKRIGESEESVKRLRLEVEPENAHNFDDLFEDPPESWNEDEAVEMWGDLLNDPEPEEGVQFGGKEQQKFEDRLGQGSALTTADSTVEHKSMVIEQDMPTSSQPTAAEQLREAEALHEGKGIPLMGADYSTRNISTLSHPQSVQHSSSSRENNLKPRFPPADTPLPEGISLDKLCRHWPHHFIGSTLRRFIEEGCTAGWIFVRLDYFVRKALDKQSALEKKKGWEVVQQRLDEEKAKMAEESKQAGLQAQFSTSQQSPELSADIPITNVRQASARTREGLFLEPQGQPLSGGTRDSRKLVPTSHIDRVNNHKHKIQHELMEQQKILRNISLADSSWVHKTPEERVQHEGQHWIDQARSYEKQIVELLGRDVVGIDFQSTRPRDVLTRQLELIRRVLIKRAPFPENASVQDIRIHNERLEATSLRQQRDVLRSWTDTLQGLLAGVRDSFSQSNETIETCSGTPGSHGAQSQAHGGHSLSTTRKSQSSSSGLSSNLPAETRESRVLGHQRPESRLASSPLDRDSRRMHYPIDVRPPTEPAAPISRPEGGSVTSKTDQSSQHPYYSSSIDGQYHAFPVFSVPQPQIGYQGIFPPTRASSAVAPTAGPSTPINTPERKRRGAPRTVMFSKAPPSNTPLSALAKMDNEEVLKSFPEHLSIPEVMRRFVRPNGARIGGWQTRKMVDYLLGHTNEKDYEGISENERRANLSRWVTKERDSCNNKVRKELGIAKKTTKSTRIVQNQSSSTSSSSLPNTHQITSHPPLAHSAPPHPQNSYSLPLQPQGGYPAPSYVQSAFSTAPYPQNQHFTLEVTGAAPAGYGRIVADAPSGIQSPESLHDRVPHAPSNQGGLSDAVSPNGSRLQGSLLNTALRANKWYESEDAEGDWEAQI